MLTRRICQTSRFVIPTIKNELRKCILLTVLFCISMCYGLVLHAANTQIIYNNFTNNGGYDSIHGYFISLNQPEGFAIRSTRQQCAYFRWPRFSHKSESCGFRRHPSNPTEK